MIISGSKCSSREPSGPPDRRLRGGGSLASNASGRHGRPARLPLDETISGDNSPHESLRGPPMITKFDSSYYGTADMENLGYTGTPINERCYSKEELANALHKVVTYAKF